MFNKNVITVLKEINKVTDTVILKYPVTVAVSSSMDVLVQCDISKLDSDVFEDVPLKDSLSEFISLFGLFSDDKSVSIEGNVVNISDDSTESKYITANSALMDFWDKDATPFEKTEAVASVATFKLTVDDIKNIKSASGVFKDLTEVIFTSKDGDVKVSLGATNKFNAKSNTYSVTKPANTSKEFEIKIPVENFKMFSESNYTVDVKYNSAKDSYRILLNNESLEGYKVLLTVKV